MAPIAILIGVLLAALGGVLYYRTDYTQPTALIPAYFGATLIVLGLLAFKDSLRKHVMHLAAVIGLVGFAMPAYFVITALINGTEFGRALIGQSIMSGLCLVFLILCIRSFVVARIERKRQEQKMSAGKI